MLKWDKLLKRIAAALESGELVVMRLVDVEQLTGQIAAQELRRVKLKTGDGVEWVPIEDNRKPWSVMAPGLACFHVVRI